MAESLRAIVVRLTTFACAWTAEEVVALSEVSLSGVKRYLTNLVHLDVLALTGTEYRAGPQARAWRDLARKHKGPSTYGNSARYRAQRAVWDGLRQRDWDAKRKAPKDSARGILTSQEAAQAMPSMPDHAGDSKMGSSVIPGASLTLDEAAETLAVSVDTIRREIKRGKLQAFRIGVRGVRITRTALDAYQTAQIAAAHQPPAKG